MKKIIYYVTDHGLGHATRAVAIIRQMKDKNVEIVIRNSNAVDFFQESLPNISVISGLTDVGPAINEDGISINAQKTKKQVGKWIEQLSLHSKKEHERISKYSPDLIISDISPLPLIVAKQFKVNSIAISNFSWYDVLDIISSEQKEILKDAYDNADLAIQLPLGTSMNHFKQKRKVGFVCRTPTIQRNQIRKNLGLLESESSTFIELGKSTHEIYCNVGKDVKVISTGTKIEKKNNTIQLKRWTEGQDLVLASDLVICKCGYGMITECITNGIPFLFISSDNHKEQKAISDQIFGMGYKNRISLEELNNITLTKEFIKSREAPRKEEIDTDNVVKHILEMI